MNNLLRNTVAFRVPKLTINKNYIYLSSKLPSFKLSEVGKPNKSKKKKERKKRKMKLKQMIWMFNGQLILLIIGGYFPDL